MKRFLPILFIFFLVVIFFWQFFIKGLLPIPADTIIGLYHPFRDSYAKDYPNGIPFKNFLITDPVRQQYPWKELTISLEKKAQLPLWNPYNFSGTPLLANFQSAPLYPLNILFFIMPFANAWSLIIFLGPLLGGFFLFLYLDNLKLNKWASLLGSTTFAFSGFFVAWMEWGTITHVGLWLPLILLTIDKIILNLQPSNPKLKIKNYLWPIIFVFSLTSAFFAGHLQTFFYLGIFSFVYFISRWLQYIKKGKVLILYIILNTLFLMLTSIQWIPTLQLILLSARNVDVLDFNNPGWFIPWQHLIQFVAPDFFGNPTTLNYWGTWNYTELVGYVGILPLVMFIFAIFFRQDKKTLFFGLGFFASLIFSLPTFFAKIPFLLDLPFISTSQPTRLLFITTFSLAVLSALGLDWFIIKRKKTIFLPLLFIGGILFILWIFTNSNDINLSVSRRNLLLPTILFVSSIITIFAALIKKNKTITLFVLVSMILITSFDLFRFGWKFTPFTKTEYLFPSTASISFLKKNIGNFRIMSTDSRILPPNFSSIYRIQSVDGYDPLYILRYAELLAASERQKANIDPPFGFNRILTPHDYDSSIIDLMGVKYILSLSELNSDKLSKVFQEGQTRVYQNSNTMPRSFFVSTIKTADNKVEAINAMFDRELDLKNTAVVELWDNEIETENLSVGEAKIIDYSTNKVIIQTENPGSGFLVFTDTFYPTWKARIDSNRNHEKIYRTDYNFRGVVVPAGKHLVEFYNSLF